MSSATELPPLLRFLRSRDFPRKLGICEKLFGRRLSRFGTCWVQTAAGPIWKLDLANATHRWLVYGGYEGPGFWSWFRRNASDSAVIVDSGANIGQTVLNFCAAAPAARVFAYEPGRAAREWLEECVAANQFRQVQISPCGLGEEVADARLGSSGGTDRHGSWNRVGSEGEQIRLTTLDREIETNRIPRIDLWKLDVEGYEIHALRGAARALASGLVRRVYMEAEGPDGEKSLDFLAARGYVPWKVLDSGVLTEWKHGKGKVYANALCLRPGEPAAN